MKLFKRIFSLLLVAVMLVSMLVISLPVNASVYKKGKCGANANWTLENNGTLTITGTGTLGPFEETKAPWYAYRDKIKTLIVSKDISRIGKGTFGYLPELIRGTVEGDITTIDTEAFIDCAKMEFLEFKGQIGYINLFAFSGCKGGPTIRFWRDVDNVHSRAFEDMKSAVVECFKDTNIYKNVAHSSHVSCRLIVCEHINSSTYYEATCSADAYTVNICIMCGEKESIIEQGSALGHSFTDYSYKNATCTENAEKTAVCDRGCGTSDTIVIEGSALGHSFTEYFDDKNESCTENGTKTAICDRGCGTKDTVIIEDSAWGHSFTEYVFDNNADCIHDGTKTAVCDNGCGISDTVVLEGSAFGHSFTEYVFDNNADCTHDGTKTAVCGNGCGMSDTVTAEGSAWGHSYTDYKVISELSCTVNGVKEAYCDHGCGEKDVITEEAEGHISGDWIVIEEADYYNEGYKIKNCTLCTEVLEQETLPMLIYKGFADVWGNSWYGEGVEYCFKHGYIMGNDKGLFMPNDTLTREQLVVILARISGAKLSEYTENIFNDVVEDSWYASSVIWASEEGLVMGVGDSRFGVGEPISREQMAVILYRYAEKQGRDVSKKADLGYCDDADEISVWAQDACGWAINASILGTTSETANILAPKMTLTRAQAAKIFMMYDAI